MRITGETDIQMSANSSTKTATLDQYLTDLVRQGYLEREEIGDPKKGTKKGGGVKRVRSNKDDDSGTQYQWRWGNRAFSEVSEQDIATFIAEIMVGDTQGQEAEDDDDDPASNRRRQKQRAEGQKKVDKMKAGIEKAAGGNLAPLK